jgi:hypothetical protein
LALGVLYVTRHLINTEQNPTTPFGERAASGVQLIR